MKYNDLTYRQLQIELKKRNLKASGKKSDLILRIEESDNNGYVDLEQVTQEEEELNKISKLFHIRTMVGSCYDIRLQNDQIIKDLFIEISNRSGASIDQIRLYTQDNIIINPNYSVGAFDYSEVFLNMTVFLRTRKSINCL